jgi:hypothetical protein
MGTFASMDYQHAHHRLTKVSTDSVGLRIGQSIINVNSVDTGRSGRLALAHQDITVSRSLHRYELCEKRRCAVAATYIMCRVPQADRTRRVY